MSKDCNSGVQSWHSLWSHAKRLGNRLPHQVVSRSLEGAEEGDQLRVKVVCHSQILEADLLLLPCQCGLPGSLGEDGPCDPHP